MRPCLSPLGEEISQDGLTLAFQHAAVHFRTMADMRIARNIPNRTACTELGIPRTEHDSSNMRLQTRAGAHRARLQRDPQLAFAQPLAAQHPRRFANRQHLGMGGGIIAADGRIAATGKDAATRSHYQRAHGHLARCAAGAGLFQGKPHQPLPCMTRRGRR